MLARPDKRLANVDPRILSDPCSHYIQVVSTFERDPFACLLVEQVTTFIAQVTVEPHICTAADREQRLVYIGHLENDAFANTRPNGHHLASSFPKLGMWAPLATSYSTPSRDSLFCRMLMPSHSERGITVTQAPESTVISISFH